MSYRFMRIMVFFDLPTETALDRRNYRSFRKYLIKSGFFMLQESVYCRMVLNKSVESSVLSDLRKNKPPAGCVAILSVTEKQFSKMEYLVGSSGNDVIDSDERLVIL